MTAVYTLPGLMRVDGLNLMMPSLQRVVDSKIDDVRLNRETVLISSYPRSGSTWLSHIVSLLLARDDKYDAMKTRHLMDRVLYLEWTRPDESRAEIEKLDSVPVPRAVKTHLPFRFIPKWLTEDKVKAIIITRNPKDTIVSYYHFYLARSAFEFSGTWNEYFAHVQAGHALYGDQYEWIKDWNDNKDKGQLLFLNYEELKQDTLSQVKRIADFLNLDVSESRMQQVVQDSSHSRMRGASEFRYPGTRPDGEQVRTGVVGGWKQYFTVEQNEWFDAKYKKAYEALDIRVCYQ